MKKIHQLVANTLRNKLLGRNKEIAPDAVFDNDLDLTAWEFNMLLFYLEGELNVRIKDDEADLHSTVSDLTNCLYAKLEIASDIALAS